MAKGDLLLLTGTAHPELAADVANELNIDLVAANIGHFPDGETSVQITDNVRGQDVFVLQPTGPPANQNLMEALVMIDALARASAKRITAVTPYFGYARQDRKDESRVPISARLVNDLYQTAGVKRMLAVDLHSSQTQGFGVKHFDHLYAGPTIRATLRDEVDNPVIVAPDLGFAKKAKGFARRMGADLAIIDKERLTSSSTKLSAFFGDSVVDRNVVIVDDMVTTAGSLQMAAAALKDRGAENVFAAATHGILCGDTVARIDADQNLDRLYVTDTLPKVGDSAKIRRITIAPLLAEAIKRLHYGGSLSDLFGD